MHIPALAEDGDGGSSGREQRETAFVLPCREAPASCGAEGAELCVAHTASDGKLKEARLLWIGKRSSGLDIADSEAVEGLQDAELVLDGIADVCALHTVAQGGVENLNFHMISPVPCLWCDANILSQTPQKYKVFQSAGDKTRVTGRRPALRPGSWSRR